MKGLFFVLMFIPSVVLAGAEIEQLLENIRFKTNETSDGFLLMRVQKELEKVEALFGAIHALNCVSRDGDGRYPYLASGLNMNGDLVKFSSMSYRDIDVCKNALKSNLVLNKNTFFCVSRDGDDSSPIQIGAVIGLQELSTQNKKLSISYKSFDTCLDSLKLGVMTDKAILVCAARDGDDSAPFKRFYISSDGSVDKKPESFASFEECRAIL